MIEYTDQQRPEFHVQVIGATESTHDTATPRDALLPNTVITGKQGHLSLQLLAVKNRNNKLYQFFKNLHSTLISHNGAPRVSWKGNEGGKNAGAFSDIVILAADRTIALRQNQVFQVICGQICCQINIPS